MDSAMTTDPLRKRAVERTEAEQRLSGLMCQAQAGDSRAYTQLLREVSASLRAFVRSRRRSSSPSDVEDLVQDIIISLHAVRSTYDPARPFTPWMMAIARNRIVDGARKHGRKLAQDTKMYDVTLSLYSPETPEASDGTYKRREMR